MKDNIRRFIPIAISAATIVITLVLQFAIFSINDRFAFEEFFPTLIINMFLLVTTACLWINAGTDRAKYEEHSAYKDNAALYATLIQGVADGGRLSDLRAFCAAKTEQLRQRKITAVLANVGIDRVVYDNELKGKTVLQLKSEEYTRRQIRAVKRINEGRVRVTPVHYMDLISDSSTADDCGVNYNETTDKSIRITMRAVRAVMTAFILALLAIEPAQDIADISAWVMFFMRVCTIVWTAYSAEREGYARITDTKNKVILRRIAFLHEFDEWRRVPALAQHKTTEKAPR